VAFFQLPRLPERMLTVNGGAIVRRMFSDVALPPDVLAVYISPLRTDSLPLWAKFIGDKARMMRSCTRRNGSNPLGSLSLHPRSGKIRADVNRQIIQK
jgi:hypothetical protein